MTSQLASSAVSFAAHLDAPMPRALRAQAAQRTFTDFVAEYAPSAGPVKLGQWTCVDERPGRRLGPQACNYQATLAVGDRIGNRRAAATGPVAALTQMLHDCGVAVEMTAFHQLPAGAHTATLIQGSRDGRTEWALGWSEDPTTSALRAVIACANRLLAHA